jgi:hypothetical protein
MTTADCRIGWVLALLLALPASAEAQIRLFPAPDQPSAVEAPRPPAPPSVAEPEPPAVEAPTPPGAAEGDAPSALTVEQLGAPSLDGLGLRQPGAGNLGRDLWQGSDGRTIEALLADLPVETANQPLRRLTTRLLITGGPVEGLAEDGHVLARRVERLLAMGDLGTARALLGQVLADPADTPLHRQQVEAALLAGDDGAACAEAETLGSQGEAPFWRLLGVYCRLAAGDAAGAQLALDLLRESGEADAAFLALAGALAADDKAATLPEDRPLGPLHLALLRRLGKPLPAAALGAAPGAIRAAALADPVLGAAAGPAEVEQAFAAGLVDWGVLAAAYQRIAHNGADADALQRVEADWSPATRGLLLRALGNEPVALARAELFHAAWQMAAGPERLLLAEAAAEPVAGLPVERGLSFAAASLARALLATGRAPFAGQWLEVLRGEGTLAADGAAARLAPLFALVARDAGDDTLGPEAIAALRESEADPAAAEQALERLFGLLDGAGLALPERAWRAALQPPFTPIEALVPPARLWRALDEAVAAERRGETVLLALHMLAGRPEAVHPEAARRALGGLRQAGLAEEVRAIALAAAIAAGL